MISIICLDNRELAPPDTTLDDDLRLSETVTGFCPNTERQRVFLSVLTNLSESRAELELRRGVLADFVSNPSLLSELRRELDELSRLHGEVNRDRARSASLSRGTYSEASSENQKHALIFLAVSVEKSLEVVVRIAELLRRGHPTSPRLCELMRHAESCTKYASELADICGRITSLLSNGGNMLVRLKINDGGRVCGFEFASGRVSTPAEEAKSPFNIKSPLSIMKLFAKPSKHDKAGGNSNDGDTSNAGNTGNANRSGNAGNADPTGNVSNVSRGGNTGAKSNNRRGVQGHASEARAERRVQLPDPGSRLRNRLSYEAYVTLSNLLSGFVRELIEGFSRLSDELTFYELALDYINMAKEKELPLCYPEIIEPESDQREPIEISRLYDLLLAGRALAAKDVVPNDVSFPTGDSVANRADNDSDASRADNDSGASRADNDSDASRADNDSGASRADNDSNASRADNDSGASRADNVSVTGSADDNSSKAAGLAGILITGENNSGKTVYLRSVGTAQLLFQAGLPVPCESARMRIFSAVYTCYAAAEKEFVSGNDAGRFEQEVRVLSQLAERIQPNSLLLLNEVFQTTAYSEGAEGLYHILNYFTRHGVNFIAVTHLKELVPLYGGRIRHLVTAPGYRIEVATDTPS